MMSNLVFSFYYLFSFESFHTSVSWWFLTGVWVIALSCCIVFSSLVRSSYLSLFSLSFNFTLWYARTATSTIRPVHLVKIRGSICISKSQRILCVSFCRTDYGLCIYTICSYCQISISCTIPTFPAQSFLVLYSFWANWLYSLIMWLMASSLLPQNLHWLFCWVLSIFALT